MNSLYGSYWSDILNMPPHKFAFIGCYKYNPVYIVKVSVNIRSTEIICWSFDIHVDLKLMNYEFFDWTTLAVLVLYKYLLHVI